MFEGQYLFSGDAVFSPWMPRSGDNIHISLEAMEMTPDAIGAAQLFHKDSEDRGPGTLVSTELARLFDVGIATAEYSGLKELVRYKFICAGQASSDYMLFRILDEVWFDDVVVD